MRGGRKVEIFLRAPPGLQIMCTVAYFSLFLWGDMEEVAFSVGDLEEVAFSVGTVKQS